MLKCHVLCFLKEGEKRWYKAVAGSIGGFRCHAVKSEDQ